MSSVNFSERLIFNVLSDELSSPRYATVEPIEQYVHLSITALFYWNQIKYGIHLNLGPDSYVGLEFTLCSKLTQK